MKSFIIKLYFTMILLSAEKPSVWEKTQYIGRLILTFSPIAFALNVFDIWYQNNAQFFTFLLWSFLINMAIGLWYHLKQKTFSWKLFFMRNSEMFVLVIVVYILLEMLRYTAGNNVVGDTFKTVIQLTTLLYPISKSLKNIFILTHKKFPPAFIMERIYNFEKSGRLKELLESKES